MPRVRMRSIVTADAAKKGPYTFSGFSFSILLWMVLAAALPVRAQDPPPRIPWFVIDAHGSAPRFPSDRQALAHSRGMQLAEVPLRGLGMQVRIHLYPP